MVCADLSLLKWDMTALGSPQTALECSFDFPPVNPIGRHSVYLFPVSSFCVCLNVLCHICAICVLASLHNDPGSSLVEGDMPMPFCDSPAVSVDLDIYASVKGFSCK